MDLFLTKVPLNLRSHEVRNDLANRYKLHQTISAAFQKTDDIRVLYRVENDTTLEPYLLVQSPTEPNADAFLRHYIAPTQEIETRNIGQIVSGFSAGQRYRFRIALNTIKQGEKDGENGKIRFKQAVWNREEILQRFERSAQERGFTLNLENPYAAAYVKTQLKLTGKTPREKLAVAVIEGILDITDPIRFADAFRAGIGKGKIFGLGMLTLAAA